MKRVQPQYSLYLVTDRALMSTRTLEEAVRQAIDGGCTLVQLREKNVPSRFFYETALSVKNVCDGCRIPLIINDRLDIALASGAAGVHVGQNDLPASAVRKAAGTDMLVGVSVASVEEAVRAVTDGADYLGVGAMFPTDTKTDAGSVTMNVLKEIRAAVHIPIVVIGGISRQTAPLFKGTGIDGFAVVSAIIARPDIRQAARELKDLFDREIAK